MLESFLMFAIAVLPADRLAMADRLFNGGKYEDAAVEYRALVGEKSIAPDGILFRLAECDRQSGRSAEAQKRYREVFEKYPDSKHAVRARFLLAMGCQGLERRRLLSGLECRVNLIRFHKIPDFPYISSSERIMEAFRDRLNAHGITCTIRASRGEDILAACGMLAGRHGKD